MDQRSSHRCAGRRTGVAVFATYFSAFLSVSSSADAQNRASLALDWATSRRDQQRDAAALRSENKTFRAGGTSQVEIAKTRLPVLVINQGPVRAAPEFRQQGTSYVAAYQLPRASLSILGSANALPTPPSAAAGLPPSAGDGYVFHGIDDDQEQDDVADLSFSRYGASYVLRLACERADDDRCRKPGFLRSVAGGLANVGGRP